MNGINITKIKVIYNMATEIKFYRHVEPYGIFSNFYPVNDLWIRNHDKGNIELWPTTENYYQAQKFINIPEIYEDFKCISPREAFNLSRKHVDRIIGDWHSDFVKDKIMARAIAHKFLDKKNKPHFFEKLKNSEGDIIEDSSIDSYWGIGSNGDGKNQLGKTLMHARLLSLTMIMDYDFYNHKEYSSLNKLHDQIENLDRLSDILIQSMFPNKDENSKNYLLDQGGILYTLKSYKNNNSSHIIAHYKVAEIMRVSNVPVIMELAQNKENCINFIELIKSFKW
jgi:N-glycosidase YbiA